MVREMIIEDHADSVNILDDGHHRFFWLTLCQDDAQTSERSEGWKIEIGSQLHAEVISLPEMDTIIEEMQRLRDTLTARNEWEGAWK